MRPMIADEVNIQYQAPVKPEGFQSWLNSFHLHLGYLNVLKIDLIFGWF